MKIEFDKEYLSDLFFKGSTADKKHRFQPEVVRGYQKAVLALAAARRIEDLFVLRSLNFETLTGDKKGISSVRCNKKYRLEFRTERCGDDETITICQLLDISNHYKN